MKSEYQIKRQRLRMLRLFFRKEIRVPVRWSAEEWQRVAGLILDADLSSDEVTALMKQAGHTERRRKRGTFYVRPTDALMEFAECRPELRAHLL